MKILFLALCLTPCLYASDLIDIIKNNQATFNDRELVSAELSRILGIDQPLPVSEAIAEICYGVDVCARATTDSELSSLCNIEDYDSEYTPKFGSACYLKSFRENYRCSDLAGSMKLSGI